MLTYYKVPAILPIVTSIKLSIHQVHDPQSADGKD